jgi:pantothenate kinase-related protein Tda10
MSALQWLAGEIGRRKKTGRPLKVAIDGRCASGKTMLADALAPLVHGHGFDALRPSVDGFHHPRIDTDRANTRPPGTTRTPSITAPSSPTC